MMEPGRTGTLAGLVAALLLAGVAPRAVQPTARPEARAETMPMPADDDAADDPAVWVHPREPALSLVLGTNKDGGLHAYTMDGASHQVVSDNVQPNNVDLLYGFPLHGTAVDIAVASVRAKGGRGIKVWSIDPEARRLSEISEGTIRVFGGDEPYGLCAYRSPRTGRFFVFVTDEDGRVEQYELQAAGRRGIGASRVRAFGVGSIAEGCVADHELGVLYVAEEEVGIWRFDAEPAASDTGTLIAKVGEYGLTAHVEGLAIYYGPGERGYLIASSQGNDTFKVFDRAGNNRFVLTIDPRGGRIDDVSHTDGIDVTNCPTSPSFPSGVFVAHDDENPGGNQNFKLYAWEDIARPSLLIHTTCRVRGAP